MLVGRVDPNQPLKVMHEDTEVLDGAFAEQRDLVSVVIGENVKHIDGFTFFGCYNLIELYNLSSVKDNLPGFASVVHTSLDEPSVLINKGDYYFYYDDDEEAYYLGAYVGSETVLDLPSDVDGFSYRLRSGAFGRSTTITSVRVPAGVKGIDRQAFYEMSKLETVYFDVTTGWMGVNQSTKEPYALESTQVSDAAQMAVTLRIVPASWGGMYRED